MLTLMLVAFPVILLLGVLAAARLERSLDRQARRRPLPIAPADEPAPAPLAGTAPIIR